jgi:hypothetical protein
MHDLAFDAIHDEIVVTSALAQAILTFRGAANGEEAPTRFIQGDKTRIKGLGPTAAVGKVSIDAVHNEIYLANGDETILVARVEPVFVLTRSTIFCWCRAVGLREAKFWFSIEQPAGIRRPRQSLKGRWLWAISLRFMLLSRG